MPFLPHNGVCVGEGRGAHDLVILSCSFYHGTRNQELHLLCFFSLSRNLSLFLSTRPLPYIISNVILLVRPVTMVMSSSLIHGPAKTHLD